MAYEDIFYPTSVDFFEQVAGGSGPSNKVFARQINKVQNGIIAVEKHTQFTPVTTGATGSMIYITTRYLKRTSDLDDPGLQQTLDITVDATVANQWFGGSPFNRQYPIFASAIGYRIVGGVRQYRMVRAGVNIIQENGYLTCRINAVKDSKWRKDDVCEITLTIVNPRIDTCPAAPAPPASSGCWLTDNLVWRFSADTLSGLNDGDLIQTWPDQSGNGWDATQFDNARKFTYKTNVINGLPVARATNSNRFMGLGAFSHTLGSQTFYFLTTYNPPLVGSGPFVIASSSTRDPSGGFACLADAGSGQVGWYASDPGLPIFRPASPSLSGTVVYTFVFDSSAGNVKVYLNSLLLNTTSWTPDADGLIVWRLGGYDNAVTTFQGDWIEMAMYDEAHDSTQVDDIVHCLLIKYNLLEEQ